MAKDKSPRKPDGSQVEHLRGEIRKLRKMVSVLRKELEKSIHYRPKVLDEVVAKEEKEDDDKCPKCKHKLKFLRLPQKDVVACGNCDYRMILPKEKE